MKKWLPMLMAFLLCAGSLLAMAEETALIDEQPEGIVLDEVEGEITTLPEDQLEDLAVLSDEFLELSDDLEDPFEAPEALVEEPDEANALAEEPDEANALTEEPAEANALIEENGTPVKIDDASFPDAAFRQFVTDNLDTDRNQQLSPKEIKLATRIDVSKKGIEDLKGIEYFSRLETLCCAKNKLTKLELCKNTALKYLDCSRNRLQTLDVSACKALEYLDCSKNKLKTLDVNALKALRELYCAGNRINKLDLGNNGALIVLNCQDNKLGSIDVSKNAELSALACQGNGISSVSTSKLSPKLRRLINEGGKGRWNDGKLFWVRSEREYLYLPGLVKLSDGRRTVFDKRNIYDHLYICDDRSYYKHLNDNEYANFRNISTTGMGKRALYRSSTPVRDSHHRSSEVIAAMKKAKVRTVINMWLNLDDATANGGYYAKTNVWARIMNCRFMDKRFKTDICDICRFMIKNKGPYLIHCKIGRDRTGFLCALLECLMGASEKEVVRDYMKTYENYYNIKAGSWEYDYIAKVRIKAQLKRAFGNRRGLEGMTLAKGAEKYLQSCGLKPEEIAALKKRLAAKY